MVEKNIFEAWAQRYFEAGIPVIPLNGKVPLVRGWQEWSRREQTQDELDDLIARYPMANIGAVLGMWASAIDIDTDSLDILSKLPDSPYQRKGKKGVVILCAPNPHPSQAPDGYPVEYLNHGRQIVLPPSIHPETGEPYRWLLETDILRFGAEDLPNYHPAILDNILQACRKSHITRAPKAQRFNGDAPVLLSNVGRNNKLTAMAYAMACDGVEVDEGAKRLLAFDRKEHSPPWFEDPTEPHKGHHPGEQAKRMLTRAIAKATKLGHVRPYVELVIVNAAAPSPTDTWTPYPLPRGIMRTFVGYCQLTSMGAQDALGIGGAIAFMSAIASNRFYTRAGHFRVWPNTFTINLAHSGFGKETPQRVLHELLVDTGLIGSSNYKSGTSIVMHLAEQQERLDLLDECSAFLKSMTSKEDYKSEIVEVLSALYTKSDSTFIGIASRADGMQFGACHNPCVNILGSTTPEGFRASVTKEMAAKGLMPRFLVFYQKHVGEWNGSRDVAKADALLASLRAFVANVLSVPKTEVEVPKNLLETNKSRRYAPMLIPMTEGAAREWDLLSQHYFALGSKNPEGFESAFRNRFAQHIAKLALLDAISLGQAEIAVDSIEWARDVVEHQWANMAELYALATAESSSERDLIRCQAIVDAAGYLSKSQFIHKTRWLYNSRARDDILKTLIDMDAIRHRKAKAENGLGRPLDLLVSTKTGPVHMLKDDPT